MATSKQAEGNEVLPTASAAETASGAVGGTPPTPEQLVRSMGEGKVVKQDAPVPLSWQGVPAVNAGGFVAADHPMFKDWDDAGYLEADPAAKAVLGKSTGR